jgi:uncharacterized protein YkwD
MCRPCTSKVAAVDQRSHRAGRNGRNPLFLALAAAGGLLGAGAALDVSGLTLPQGPLVAADTTPLATAGGRTGAADRADGQNQSPAVDAASSGTATAPRGAGRAGSGSAAASAASANPDTSGARGPGGGAAGASQGPPTSAGAGAQSPSAAAAAAGTQLADGYAAQVMALVNQVRSANGCAALRPDPAIARAAADHSRDMAVAGYFAHNSPAGVTPWTRMERDGYSQPGGENIARGFAAPKDVVAAWLASPEHRANILNCRFRSAGVGYYAAPAAGPAAIAAGSHWTQDFGYS